MVETLQATLLDLQATQERFNAIKYLDTTEYQFNIFQDAKECLNIAKERWSTAKKQLTVDECTSNLLTKIDKRFDVLDMHVAELEAYF